MSTEPTVTRVSEREKFQRMTAVELVTLFHGKGVTLTARGDRLHVDAPQGALTPAFRAALREHKAAVLDLLEAFEERAAIMEYDGRLPGAEAERRAWVCLLGEAQP